MAECYACLSALPSDREACALAARLSAPYLHALECEYGVADVHNVAMRRFVASHCAHCGAQVRVRVRARIRARVRISLASATVLTAGRRRPAIAPWFGLGLG